MIGIVFESRLPKFRLGIYDNRITQGLLGLRVNAEAEQRPQVMQIMNAAGAVDVKTETDTGTDNGNGAVAQP